MTANKAHEGPPSQLADTKRRRPRLDKDTRHKLIALFAVVTGFTIVILLIGELLGGTEKLRSAVEESGAWAPLVYTLLKTVSYVIAPLSGASIELASGALFGVWVGTLLSTIGSVIGGSINYWIARTLGRTGIAKFAGKKAIAQVDSVAERVGSWRILLAARVILAPMYDFISYAAGLARFPYIIFILITFFAGLPVNLVFPLLGHLSTTNQLVTLGTIIITAILFVGFLVAHAHGKRSRSKTSSTKVDPS